MWHSLQLSFNFYIGPPLIIPPCRVAWPNDSPAEHFVDIKIGVRTVALPTQGFGQIERHACQSLQVTSVLRVILYEYYIPFDDNLQKSFKTIRFDVTEGSEVSEPCAAGVPSNGINLLVEVPKLLEDRRKFNAKRPAAPPLSMGDPKRCIRIQETDTQKIVWSRPLSTCRFNDSRGFITPIFRQFINVCENHQPINKDRKLVRN